MLLVSRFYFLASKKNHYICNLIQQKTYVSVGEKIEKGAFRDALADIFEIIRFGNVYYDAKQPWKTRTENLELCRETIGNCIYLIANAAVLLSPFLPFSSSKIAEWLGIDLNWREKETDKKELPSEISILFSRIDIEE